MEKFFWADATADKIIKERKGKKEFVCASGITPSGTVHIGNFREVITTDLVVRALKDRDKKVRFIYSWDDYDRFRKVPANVPENKRKKYEEYLGMPISEIPSPFNPKMNYAEYNEKKFEGSLSQVGISPKFIYQNKMNKACKYAKLIKVALDKKDEIVKILNEYRKEPLSKDWMPIMVYCSKCKKDTTKILAHKGYEIEYECACGFREKFDFRKKGLISIRWRVDWPLRWKYEGVDFEPGGIDHSVVGGSFTTAKEISKEVFGFEPPIYQFYEWINLKGIPLKEFHSSRGNVVTLDEVLEIYEPEVLRYIFVSTRPNKAFEISFDAGVIKIYEEYDELENKYYNKTATAQERRIYELSQVGKVSKTKLERIGFKHLITLVQAGKVKGINSISKDRAKRVKGWLDKYAPEDFKFEIKDKIEFSLGKKQKEALKALKESLVVKDFTEDELFNEFYAICEAVNIDAKEFFNAAYSVIIGKTRGPRLAALILAVGKDKVVNLLERIK